MNSSGIPEIQSPAQAVTTRYPKRVKKTLFVICFLVIAYLGSAVVFREYRMDPKNKYQGTYLPGAPNPTEPISYSIEEAQNVLLAPFKKPTVLERVFAPAEAVFRVIGY